MTELFTSEQLETLRGEYARIATIDPSAPTYPKLTALLRGMSVEQLKQVRDAKIRFLSRLAINRIPAEAA